MRSIADFLKILSCRCDGCELCGGAHWSNECPADRSKITFSPDLSVKKKAGLNPVITYKLKRNFGGDPLIYVTSEHMKPLQDLTGAKTINSIQKRALEQLGFTFQQEGAQSQPQGPVPGPGQGPGQGINPIDRKDYYRASDARKEK
jgi:hypothetical protein